MKLFLEIVLLYGGLAAVLYTGAWIATVAADCWLAPGCPICGAKPSYPQGDYRRCASCGCVYRGRR